MTPEQWLVLALLVGLGLVVGLVLAGWLAARRTAELARPGAQQMGGATDLPGRPSIEPELMAMADELDVGLLRLSADGTIELANDAAQDYLGRSLSGLAGRSTMEAFVDHRVDELVGEARQRGAAERELAFAGEPQRTLLIRVRRAADDGGLWLVMRDLSELRRLQRIRTEFLDNLSHELRTPLTNVRLLTESLAMEVERSAVPERVRDGLARIDVETGHLAQMVTELLDLARIEQGATTLRSEPLDLARPAESAVDRLRLYAERQGVTVRAELVGDAAERTVSGDPDRLEQLMVNLLHNAIKFSPAGGAVVVRVGPAGADVRAEVADHGPGIPRRDLERIFERFYKVDRARTRGGPGGTGLGLSIARHVTEGHGGRISVESEEGRGARFIVDLPRASSQPD